MILSIDDMVTSLSGVGDKRAEALSELGIKTIRDLLTYYPFRFEDLTTKSIEQIEDNEKVVLEGIAISEGTVSYFGRKRNRLSFRINCDHVIVPVTFFNQPYLKKQIEAGKEIKIFGKWDATRKQLSGIKILSSHSTSSQEAIYHTSKKIRQSTIFQLIKKAWEKYSEVIPEDFPETLRQKYHLMSFKDMIYFMHFPTKDREIEQARYSVIFREFFSYQLKMIWLKKQMKMNRNGQKIDYDVKQLITFFDSLPYELTAAQKRVVNEVCKDLKTEGQMFRLIQGDVGSGKTVVAASAILAAKSAEKQSALMAPTEILATQHKQSLDEMFDKTEINIALLTGSTKRKERNEILEQLSKGEIDCLIGTHALIQEDVLFESLGLVITDEQHRFGVNQRKVLREKGQNPDVLFMTATPIPRTLSITTYGEMDVSIIDEMPLGRKPIKTYWIRPKHFDRMTNFLNNELAKGHQVYVISPLIEESEMMDVENATALYHMYQEILGKKRTVGLLHGKMPAAEKEAIMEKFQRNEIQVLVSTTVIEVGVNVSNATLMIIHDADRFGLAQLHQLRGRVGRGEQESYCILIADPKGEKGAERMQIVSETTDGFVLSQRDLEMRGSGDIFGKKQSGLPEFKVGDIVEDFDILEKARKAAQQLIQTRAFYTDEAYTALRDDLGITEDNVMFLD
ncbi:ATP-dependent DNA helicase RecG [Alkalibacterium gilvum]|uniref:ATP-dependent DNA helicase RecG n=1 Tax=Alkalibacterium gilvum TaxID=1130080 RepID=A0A1H6QWC7_9LACT|nr:ATP-dependent DNA helicase RecG [Alkalibacterium gilvum]